MSDRAICARCGHHFTIRGLAVHLRMTHGIGTTRQAKRRRMLGMERAISTIRRAVADYMGSEGCGCCSDRVRHEAHTAMLAKLLSVPMYNDKSGYDFRRYQTKVGSGEQSPPQ